MITTREGCASTAAADMDAYRAELKDAAAGLIALKLPITVSNGKNPGAAMGDGWQHQRLTVEQAEALIDSTSHPTLGVMHGAGGSIVFDIDNESERRAFMDLFDQAPPPMAIDVTGREGGEHRHAAFHPRLTATGAGVINYKSPSGDSIKVRIGADRKGAHSVIAPSLHAEKIKDSASWRWTGKRYRWLEQCALDDIGLVPTPERVVDKLIAAVSKAAPAASLNGNIDRTALAAMRRSTVNMVDGADGSKRLYCAACRAVEFDLTDEKALATINAYAVAAPFPSPFTDSQILDRVRDAEKKVTRGSAVIIANFSKIDVEAGDSLMSDGSDKDPDAESAAETITVPKPMAEIIDDIHALSGNWPRRVDNMLFIDDAAHGLGYFDRRGAASLFGWLRGRATVKWAKGGSYVAQAELFAEVERTAQRYNAIEALPHEPLIDGIYYHGKTPPEGDGSHLAWLLNRFRPATTVDRDLIQAAFMTAFWGGAAGRRPAFVFTSDDGRGVGKSTVAEMIGHLCGGVIDVSAGEDIQTLKTRFLSPSARTIRIALLDNIKTMRLSWAELESLITSPVISGRQLFVGEGQRPNLLLWCLTLNGISLATDMAQRSIIVKVVKGENAGAWHSETTRYIDEHRQQIIGDIVAALRGERFDLTTYSRWATWEQGVLCRLAEPGEIQKVILERQGEANCELDEAEIIEQYFAEQLHILGYAPMTAQVRVPVATAAFWFSKAVGEPVKTAAASKRIHQMANEGQLKRLSPDKSRTHGRSVLWTGQDADVFGARIENDLASRIADYLNRHNGGR